MVRRKTAGKVAGYIRLSGKGTAARGKYEILNLINNRTMVGKSGREGYLERVGWKIWQLNF